MLGLLLFLVLINDLGFSNQTNDLGDIITCKKRIKAFNEIHLKYVDDLTIGEAIKMKENWNQYQFMPGHSLTTSTLGQAMSFHQLTQRFMIN